jgi:hypothetical protein
MKKSAVVKWEHLEAMQHDLKGDITFINGLDILVRQTWFKSCPKEDLEPVISHLNKLRWRIQDRVEQINDIVNDNNKE